MRRWRRIKDGTFNRGDILTLERDDKTPAPYMKHLVDGKVTVSETRYMEEIDDVGRVIRTYKQGELINEGTIIGGAMNKDEAMKRLEAIEKETAELKKIIGASDRLVYNGDKIYIAYGVKGPYILLGRQERYFFYELMDTEYVFDTAVKTGQEAINIMYKEGFSIEEFTNRKEALEFFLSKCEE